MDQDVLYFFDGKPEALPLYEAFEERVFSEVDGVKVKVRKTPVILKETDEMIGQCGLTMQPWKEDEIHRLSF